MSEQYQKLVSTLKTIFELDKADLDFGIYRILNQKRAEITKFLEKDLLPQVKEAFLEFQDTSKASIQEELDKLVKNLQDAGVDPDASPKVQELKKQLASAVDTIAIENEIFSHLHKFFSRYYDKGDFISQRRYKDGVYAIPYNGEEVKLYWANYDQYYIKSSEYLKNYVFKVGGADDHPYSVHFQISSADTEKDNIKATNEKERKFVLDQEKPLEFLDENNLVVRFRFEPGLKDKQDKLNQEAIKTIFEELQKNEKYRKELLPLLQKKAPTEKQKNRTILEKHLTDFTARHTFDYFIHKDLGGFLKRELDFYIKNEVLYLDDLSDESVNITRLHLRKIKVLKEIGHKIIRMLAQLEDFQKRLWLKKKFVYDTQYCLTLDRVPRDFWPEIVQNERQWQEWVRLGFLEDNLEPSKEILEQNQFMMIDTAHFGEDFKYRLLERIGEETGDIDDQLDGLLVHGENFQALNLLMERYREQVKCIYIDPPYNTGDSEIFYKNGYKCSSWLSLMENRLTLSIELLSSHPVLFIAIDDFEMADLCQLIDRKYSFLRREMIIVNHHPQGGKAKTLANTHEYMLTCVRKDSDITLRGRFSSNREELRPFKRSGTAESNFRKGRPNSFYAILVDKKSKKVVGLEPPPPLNEKYPSENTTEGFLRIYPIGQNNEERVWRRTYTSGLKLFREGKLFCSQNYTIYQRIKAEERTPALFSNWVDPKYNSGTYGANLINDIFGTLNPFSYPKSIFTVEDAIFSTGMKDNEIAIDYFAGSGTTAHAVINLNREDGGNRKYILVEMAHYFDTVLMPRIKKVVYSKDWKEGHPTSPDTGISHAFKYIRIESYEDTLNNLKLKPETKAQQETLAFPEFKEDYMLGYWLDVETKDSPSLLNLKALENPFDYKMRIATKSVAEPRPVKIDLIETFNWFLGLKVKYIYRKQGFFVVQGRNIKDESILIIWRNLKEHDNETLEKFLEKSGYNPRDTEFDKIYVNGDHTLEDPFNKVRLIEQEFRNLMFQE